MNEDRISKHIEFKDSLKAYKEYLSKLNMEAKKKLDDLNNKDLDLREKILGILDKRDLKKKIKKREEKLEIIGEITSLDSKAHLSGDVIYSQNEAVIAALNALPVLDEMAEKKISASFVNEESKKFAEEKKSIEKDRKRERELVASITPNSGFVKIGDNEYKRLADLFEESLGDLSVFDLKINTNHQNVDAKLAESLIAKEISLLNDYKKYVLEGKMDELESLPVKTVDRVKDILVLHAKNKFCLDKLKELFGIMPKKNTETCKLITENINYYQEKVDRVLNTINIDFNNLAAIIEKIEAEERRKREEERKNHKNYSLAEQEEVAKKLAILSFSKIDCINKGEDTSLVDEEINELLESDMGKSLDAIKIYEARRAGAERYAFLKKIPFDEEVFRASLETKTGKKM